MGRLRLAAWFAPDVKKCLHLRQSPLAFARERVTRGKSPVKGVEHGLPRRCIRAQQRRQGVDGALCVMTDNKVLFPDDLLELCEGPPPVDAAITRVEYELRV